MKLEVNKNELERALIALGKLVSRTASLPQFRSLQIETTERKIHFSTCTPLEQITFQMESPSEGAFHCVVPFEEFRMAHRSCRNKTLELEYGEGILRVGETTLLHEQSVEWPVFCKGEQEALSELPKEFVSLLAKVAPLVDREEAHSIMRGINLSREGITATNGRELLHIPLPLNVDDFTIPLPIALLQTRTKEEGGRKPRHLEQPRRKNMPRGNGTLDLAGIRSEGKLSGLASDHSASKLSGSLCLVSAGARGTACDLSQECARAGAAQSRGTVSERGSGVFEHSRWRDAHQHCGRIYRRLGQFFPQAQSENASSHVVGGAYED